MNKVVDLAGKLDSFHELWSPRIIARMNDYEFKVVKLKGEFVWHQHDDTDETFIVLRGHLVIELRDGNVEMDSGQMYVVPRGVEHKPRADAECHVLLVEPAGTVNTGDAGGERTAEARWLE